MSISRERSRGPEETGPILPTIDSDPHTKFQAKKKPSTPAFVYVM